MEPSAAVQELRDRYFHALVAAVIPLKDGPDPEMTLEGLIQAAQLLEEHLAQELAELRQEQVE